MNSFAPVERAWDAYAPVTIVYPLTIDARDFCIDGVGRYDADTGVLLSVCVNGNWLKPNTIRVMLSLAGCSDYTRWADALDPGRLDVVRNSAAYDAYCEAADERREVVEDF